MGGVFSGRRYWENSTRKKSFTVEFSSIDSLQVHKSLSQAEDGYLGDNTYLWRVPCPWKSRYLLSPFTESSNEYINYGRPFSV